MTLQAKAAALAPTLTAWRRHLHANPELSFHETETARYIREHLTRLNIPFVTPTGNSTVATIAGRRPGKTVALRADIDALPIIEENSFAFKSARPGVMHACGHDGHTAMLMGAAQILAADNDFAGTLKLVFQEAEEVSPGGAQALVDAGALQGVDQIVGLHLISDIPTGRAAICAGPMMASADSFDAVITGRGGHGAYPHQTVDAVVVAANFVMNLQTVVSRKVDPLNPSVVTVGTIQAGFTHNVIAPSATLKGTVRAFDEGNRKLLQAEIERTLQATCALYGATGELRYEWGPPPLVNHPAETAALRQAAAAVLGADQVDTATPVMGAEDFAAYTRVLPGAFLFLGCRSEAAGSTWPHHHPRFTIDEAALPHGVEILVRTALHLLG